MHIVFVFSVVLAWIYAILCFIGVVVIYHEDKHLITVNKWALVKMYIAFAWGITGIIIWAIG